MNKRKILYFKGQFYTGKSENKWVKGKSFFKWLALLHTDQKLRILFGNKNLFGKFTFNVAASLIRNNPIQKFRDFREFQWISEWSYLLWVTVTVYCWEKAEEKKWRYHLRGLCSLKYVIQYRIESTFEVSTFAVMQ